MSDGKPEAVSVARDGDSKIDQTGRSRMGRNLLSLWIVEVVVIISGFVTPRLIHEQLGQVQLGIWDLGWSIVSYFRFIGEGMTGGLNRFVALHNASGQLDKLGRIVSSAIALQSVQASATLLLTLVAAYYAPDLLDNHDAEVLNSVRWVVVFLGATLAVRMLTSSTRALLTGRHLWTVNSAVQCAGDVSALAAMIIVLLMGGGLRELAGAYFGVGLLTEVIRFAVARTVYGRAIFRMAEVSLAEIKEIFVYAMKTNAGVLSQLVVVQTLNIVLASTAGPAVLAVYARSIALQRHASTVVSAFAKLLMPAAGSLQGLGREAEYKPFFLQSVRSAFALALPLYILLAIFGDLLLFVWMGPEYVEQHLLTIICLGMLWPTTNNAIYQILAGLNMHGLPSVVAFIGATLLLGLGILVFSLGDITWSATNVAILLGICLTFGSAMPVTVIACRRFGVRLAELLRVVSVPLIGNIPFLALLYFGARRIDMLHIGEAFAIGVPSILVLAASYWFLVLSDDEKRTIMQRFGIRARTR